MTPTHVSTKCGCRLALAALAVLTAAARAGEAEPNEPAIATYPTPYYTLRTDLPKEAAREAAVRMTALAEEYHRRTKGFSGTIRQRLPLLLLTRQEDFRRAGGLPGAGGFYDGKRLVALAGRADTWHIVQHEAFHQFAHRAIRADLPIWVEEGLAEYFGQGLWTGDGFVTGRIPPERLRRLRRHIEQGQIVPFLAMFKMSHLEWNGQLSIRNYDQAWSMVHFLVHADDGKYRQAFSAFINDIAADRPWTLAFVRRFGRDVDAFQRRYEQWWQELPEDPTAHLHRKALVQTLTSFLARAHVQGLRYDRPEAFFQAARDGQIRPDERREHLWLPPALLTDAATRAQALEGWSFGRRGRLPTLVLTDADGTTYTGTFRLSYSGPPTVDVDIQRPTNSARD